MKTYTVVMRRTQHLQCNMGEEPEPADVYVAEVTASEPMEAVRKAKDQVRVKDRAACRSNNARDPIRRDYINLAVFEGSHEPVLLGCVTGGQG